MAERSLSFGLPVTSGECSKMHSKCTSCDDLERAVVHTSTNSSCEISCTINFIVPLLIKTDRVSFCKTVCCQCKIEILLIGKFIRINTCRKGKPGTKFLGVWREGDCCGLRVMWFCCLGGMFGCCLSICDGVFLSVWTCTCSSGVTLSVFAGAIILPKNKRFMLQET